MRQPVEDHKHDTCIEVLAMKVMPVDKDYTVNNLNETLMQVDRDYI